MEPTQEPQKKEDLIVSRLIMNARRSQPTRLSRRKRRKILSALMFVAAIGVAIAVASFFAAIANWFGH